MNKITKKLIVWGLTLACACSLAPSASAGSIVTATSVGVNYNYENDDGTTSTHDFVTNATNANAAYSSISTCNNASLITAPQAAQLREAIKANVVFLNSHANAGFIRFKYYYGTTLRNFDVRASTTNSSHVSLSDLSLSNVDLIQFFGCHTAENNSSGDSLISVAHSKGADLAVGFEGTISTRTTAGRNWLNVYQSKLASGNSWISAFAAACAAQPGTNIQSNMRYTGNSSLSIAPTSSTQSLSSNTMSIDIDNVKFDDKIDWSEETAFSIASELNLGIDINDYNCSFTLLNEDDNAGVFVFDYDIGENITSNKSYAVVIMDGKVTNVFANNENVQINQDVIANKYSTLSSAVAQTASPISLENVVDTEEQYTYDCSTGKLTYTYVAYTEEDGVIIDNVVELEV